jgi:GTP-binding protein LepA
MEIIQERIEREYNLDVLFTAPSVEYEVLMIDNEVVPVDSPAELPDPIKIVEVREPWMTIEIITPTDYYGPIMELVTSEARHLQATGISRPSSCAIGF